MDDGPPPPPPPHGANPHTTAGSSYRKSTGLPDGSYDIFIIPPHSAGSGFLYLPSLQCHRNSFIAGSLCTLLIVLGWLAALPTVKSWLSDNAANSRIGMIVVVILVGAAGWAGGTYLAESSSPGGPQNSRRHGGFGSGTRFTRGQNFSGQFGGAGPAPESQYPGEGQYNAGNPPPHGQGGHGTWDREYEEARRKEEEEARKQEEERQRKGEEMKRKEEEARRKEEERRRKEEEEARRKEEEEARRKEEEEARRREELRRKEELRCKEEVKRKEEEEVRRREEEARRKKEEARLREEEARRMEEERRRKEEAWRKEEEMRRREEEARLKEEARRKEEETTRKEEETRRKVEEAIRKEEEAIRKEEEAARKEEEAIRKEEEAIRKEDEARRKEEAAKRKEEEARRIEEEVRRKEEETRRKEEIRRKMEEYKRKREAEQREKQRQREKEEMERELREHKERLEREVSAAKEAAERKVEREAAERAAREKAEKEAAEREAREQAEKEAAEKEAAAKETARKEAAARFAAAKDAAAKKFAAAKEAAEAVKDAEAKEAAAKEAAANEAAAKEAAAKEAASKASPRTSARTAVPRTPSPQKPQHPTVKTATEDDAYSFRPYDRPRRPYGGPGSVHSESSYAPSQSTARTTPPPLSRTPYSTKDPDKVIIQGVYAFNNAFMRTPIAKLVSGQGSITDGLILRITTEGLFVDDDVRGVGQREWDVKAWTMKLIEVRCPLFKESPARQNAPKPSPFRRGTAQTAPTSEESDAFLADLLKVCKGTCRLASSSACFSQSGSGIDRDTRSMQKAELRSLHVVRASLRDQEGKKYVFVLQESEGWKVSLGLQRLRRGTQARALGVVGMPVNESKALLDNLGYT